MGRRVPWLIWKAISVLAPCAVLCGGLAVFMVVVIPAVRHSHWGRFGHGPRADYLVRVLHRMGFDTTDMSISHKLEELAEHLAHWMLSFVETAALTAIFLVFLLTSWLRETTRCWMPPEVHTAMQRYVRLKTFTSAIIGVVTGLILWSFDVVLWQVFAGFSFMLNFVPCIGVVVAVCLPVPLMILDRDQTLENIMWIVLLPGLLHFLVLDILEPRLLGHTLHLHPITVVLSLTLWGTAWGSLGTVMSVPLTSTIKILLAHVPRHSPLKHYADVLLHALGGD
eukprot:NODE_2260_length_966_cov_508.193194.p1 GENE.NODE_2260_length_966_cov_508.193194~~NODE_2260_length_966_cov_508.193194.p1  ORF type:complete len:281 (+),score=86.97 NODE_2260_length_966_cov_508.193194:3-845(+)